MVERKSLLIVDDLQPFAEILSDMVRKRGHDAICAFDYDTAIKIAEKRHFDCALLDYSLGDGKMTGIDIARDIRKSGKSTKIILMSGETDKDILQYMRSLIGLTIDHFIRKPFPAEDIFKYI